MIFYFSGTGNSKWVAQTITQSFTDKLVAIGDYYQKNNDQQAVLSLEKDEKIGFVFPVHSWGTPPIVKQFIQKLQFENFDNNLIYCVFTCGNICGNADKMFLEALQQKNWKCHHIYSVQMPNNYISMPGFGIDPVEVQKDKIAIAQSTLKILMDAILTDKPIQHYARGKATWLKSGIIYPLFVRFGMNSRPFYTTESCISCGICEQKCPVKNIKITEGKPVWDNNCTQCLACIHYCPTQAIQYGKVTINKGRYTFPEKQH